METVVRVLIVYLFILAALRVLGKREFSQLSPFELVMLLLIPELVAHSLLREDYSLTNGLVAVSTLMVLVFLTSLLSFRSTRAQTVLEGTPSVLVHRGRFLESNLSKERVTPGEVFDALHQSGLARLEQVEWAILETGGKISVVPAEQNGVQKPPETELVA